MNEDKNEDMDMWPTSLLQDLMDHWTLDDPKLVISLIGGYRKNKHITPTVRKTFVRELVIAVLSTGMFEKIPTLIFIPNI